MYPPVPGSSTSHRGQTSATAGEPAAASADLTEWQPRVDRLVPLVDGIEYFRWVRHALLQARRQVLIVGWELHSEIDLLRGEEAEAARHEDSWPVRLADLLLRLVKEREDLEIRLLIWAGASLFALERQNWPRMKRPWADHSRIRLVWDGDTPKLASQHQKVVVIDDAMAFAGGMDLTKCRWDDHQHAMDDPRRRAPGLIGRKFAPYHDIMMALDGEAAGVLGDWCRERWRRATGDALPAPGDPAVDVWPAGLEPLLRDRRAGIALTQPAFNGRSEKRQVEASFYTQIAAARESIFIETQYLTCAGLVEQLCRRLREPDGPEIVIIIPYGCPGTLQSVSMDPPRDALLDRLRAADTGGRLGVYWPTLRGGATENPFETSVYIHAKTMVVDDRLLRIGSANLNNRSMGLDTELDVFVEVPESDDEARAAIAGYRQRLLAYLLAVPPAEVQEAERANGSVVGAVEAVRSGSRTLHPFEHHAEELKHAVPLPLELADPDRPLSDLDAQRVLKAMDAEKGIGDWLGARADEAIGIARRWHGLLITVAVVLAVALVWAATPLHEIANRAWLEGAFEAAQGSAAGIGGVAVAFLTLAASGFPVTVLIVVTGAMFDMAPALVICVVGVLGSAFLNFMLGRLSPALVPPLKRGGGRHGIVERLKGRGVLAVAIVRNVPLAPFAVVNIGCGAAGLSLWRYLLGTLLGMLPGIVVVVVFGHELAAVITDPTPTNLAGVVAGAVAVIGLAVAADALLRRIATEAGERRSRDTASDTGRD